MNNLKKINNFRNKFLSDLKKKSICNPKLLNKKIYIISENVILENNETWIIDTFTNDFKLYSNLEFTDNINEANIIWIIGYNFDLINKINPNNKIIITTVHHIDWNKFNDLFFKTIEPITTYYHVICPKVELELRKITNKEIKVANFWINEKIFYNINDKVYLRNKYSIPNINYTIVGSFQRDTEGKLKCMRPKLSKGPDILIKILIDMKNKDKNPFVVLTGRRRNYIIDQLQKNNIPFIYKEMVTSNELNELYNSLDLYIVSSRIEGGPRAIIECAIAKIPIISTDVGIAELILNNNSIYDVNNYLTYENVKPDIEYGYEKASEYSLNKYMEIFIEKIFV